MDIMEKVKELQEIHGLSVVQFAKRAKLSPSTVRNLLKQNCNPRMKTVFAICLAFSIPAEVLLDENINFVVFGIAARYPLLNNEQKRVFHDLIKLFKATGEKE